MDKNAKNILHSERFIFLFINAKKKSLKPAAKGRRSNDLLPFAKLFIKIFHQFFA